MQGLYLFFLFVKLKNAGNITIENTYYKTYIMKQERLIKAQSISKKIISEYLVTDLKDLITTHWIVTITQVEISNDLSYMDIHASCMMNAQTLTKELSEHAHSLQRKLWKEMALVKVPKIRFRYDDSGESSSQIYTTIKNLNI